MGLEPTTFAMARRRSSQLSYIRLSPTDGYQSGARLVASPAAASTPCWRTSVEALEQAQQHQRVRLLLVGEPAQLLAHVVVDEVERLRLAAG